MTYAEYRLYGETYKRYFHSWTQFHTETFCPDIEFIKIETF